MDRLKEIQLRRDLMANIVSESLKENAQLKADPNQTNTPGLQEMFEELNIINNADLAHLRKCMDDVMDSAQRVHEAIEGIQKTQRGLRE